MVTIAQLRKEKARLLAKQKQAQDKRKLQLESAGLQKEIKVLKRTPSQIRNVELARRTARGLKIIGQKAGQAAVRQAKRIREQQERDADMLRKTTKSKGKKIRTGQKLSKIKEGKGFDVFANLDF